MNGDLRVPETGSAGSCVFPADIRPFGHRRARRIVPAARRRATRVPEDQRPTCRRGVQINGSRVSQTPYKVDDPGGYFHKTHTAFSEPREHPIVPHISKNGFISRQITLSDGRFQWMGLRGYPRGTYFLLKADPFERKLDSTDDPGDRSLGDEQRPGPIRAHTKAAGPKPEITATDTSAIRSEPSGADIHVGAKFSGPTSSLRKRATGTHPVEIRNTGRKSWSGETDIPKDSEITLRP